jgi:hypothetical protein
MMMMTYRKAHTVIKSVVFVFASVFFLTSCQEDEFTEVREDAATAATAVNLESKVESLTITGTHAFFSTEVECSTCTYVVPANATTVDGAALGLKPGSVICLDAALKYGNLEFVNLNGSEASPITIGTCN